MVLFQLCAACGETIQPFGTMRHRFIAEDLGAEICIECARLVAPAQVAAAEALERKWVNERGS